MQKKFSKKLKIYSKEINGVFMKKKKGYMLTETVVAIAIILLISFSFFSLSLFVNSNYQKSNAITFGVNQIENILSTFLASSFAESEVFTTAVFENNLNFVYNSNEFNKQNITAEKVKYTIVFDSNFQIAPSGEMQIVFDITKSETQVSFFAKLFKNSKQIYEMPTAFYKAVA